MDSIHTRYYIFLSYRAHIHLMLLQILSDLNKYSEEKKPASIFTKRLTLGELPPGPLSRFYRTRSSGSPGQIYNALEAIGDFLHLHAPQHL